MSGNVSLKSLTDDLARVYNTYGEITRKLYRRWGNYSETQWTSKFDKFSDFVAAANIVRKETVAPESHELKGNKWDVSLKATRIHTLPELLEYCKVDLAIWEVERFIVNKWEMGYKNPAGKAETEELFQVKATLIKNHSVVNARAEIDLLKEEAKKFAKTPKMIVHTDTQSGNILEIALFDLHAGGLAWGKETGGPDWDTKIAVDTFNKAVAALLDRAKGYKFDHILLVTGGDLLNSDDLESRTTKGTTVTSDTRFKKTFVTVRKMLTTCIEHLRLIAPVTVIVVPGNHDELSSWTMGDSLESYFHNYTDVVIDNSPLYRKYFRWGQTLFLFTHGDAGKRSDYPLLMATENGNEFGDTRFHEIHTGHYHQTKTEEFHGVRVRIIPSLKSQDDWHAKKMFVGQQREAVGFVFNKEQGLLAQFIYNADV